jgi:hypothetical protein
MDPKHMKALQEEYGRLVFATGWSAASSKAAAAAELARVHECVAALVAEARQLLTAPTLQALLQASSNSGSCSGSSIINGSEALLAAARAVALLNEFSAKEAGAPADNPCGALKRQLEAVLATWRLALSVKDDLDVFWEGAWYRCKVKQKGGAAFFLLLLSTRFAAALSFAVCSCASIIVHVLTRSLR